MCCLGNYGKENGNVMCSWMNADKIGRLSRNQKEAAFTKVKESKSESEPKERSSIKVKESKSESEPKERISKEFGKDKETGSGQEHYGGVAGVCILIVVVVVVVCTIAAAGKEGRAHLCRILQDCWQKIRRGGPRFAATTSRRVPVSFRRRLNSITTI
ncbi:uncharacterized protein LOC101853218 [Aplysia californica]|uniref:Uncharacterized protein LOC101853218 n=1 Tax=Aplysia californica TaxID=6500 RepID=A0ABM0KAK4_APLCA|nr:uncharacterized protein LOC101853218 [Aplysia californica]